MRRKLRKLIVSKGRVRTSIRSRLRRLQPTSFTIVTDRITLSKAETDTELIAVAEELKSEGGLLEYCLTDLHNKADKRLNTEIFELYDSFPQTWRCEGRRRPISHQTLPGRPRRDICKAQPRPRHYFTRLDGFAITHAQADESLNRFEAITEPSDPQASPITHPPVAYLPKSFPPA